MKLKEWIKDRVARELHHSKKEALLWLKERIEKQGGETVSFITLQNVEGGKLLSKYAKAEAIEKATGGEVTVKELCS